MTVKGLEHLIVVYVLVTPGGQRFPGVFKVTLIFQFLSTNRRNITIITVKDNVISYKVVIIENYIDYTSSFRDT